MTHVKGNHRLGKAITDVTEGSESSSCRLSLSVSQQRNEVGEQLVAPHSSDEPLVPRVSQLTMLRLHIAATNIHKPSLLHPGGILSQAKKRAWISDGSSFILGCPCFFLYIGPKGSQPFLQQVPLWRVGNQEGMNRCCVYTSTQCLSLVGASQVLRVAVHSVLTCSPDTVTKVRSLPFFLPLPSRDICLGFPLCEAFVLHVYYVSQSGASTEPIIET